MNLEEFIRRFEKKWEDIEGEYEKPTLEEYVKMFIANAVVMEWQIEEIERAERRGRIV